MIVRIQLLARLLRIRLLRVEGVVAISDGDLPPTDPPGMPVVRVRLDRDPGRDSDRDPPALGSVPSQQEPAYGRDLAEAEAILAQMPARSGLLGGGRAP